MSDNTSLTCRINVDKINFDLIGKMSDLEYRSHYIVVEMPIGNNQYLDKEIRISEIKSANLLNSHFP